MSKANLFLSRWARLQLFPDMHQSPVYPSGYPIFWGRSSGGVKCEYCGLTYREHRNAEEFPLWGDEFDKRLCNGDIVHL